MGSTPKVPPPPAPTTQELALMEKQTQALDKYLQSVDVANASQEQMTRLSQIASGVYDPVFDETGNLTGTTLNRSRLDTLRADLTQNEEIGRLQAETYVKALKGELPVSAATLENKRQEFRLLKENAARRGINIQGDTPETATSDSTSGNEIVRGFATRYGLIEDQERRGNFAMGYAPVGNQTVGLLTQANQNAGASAPAYAGAVGLGATALQPYQQQRTLQFQTGYQNALNRAQTRSDYAGLLTQMPIQSAQFAFLAK